MSKKPVLWRKAKSVLTRDSVAFQEKLLCDGLTLNAGDLCVYSCSFCYVESQIWKLVHREVNELRALPKTHLFYRYRIMNGGTGMEDGAGME